MSDNVKKALESTDVSVIKRAFRMEEGQVTKYVDRIHAILKIYDENGSYNRESIYKVELREAVAGLRESFIRVERVHSWLHYQLLKMAEDSDAEENGIEKEVNEYILPVENKYFEGLIAIDKYNPQWFNLASEIDKEEVALIKGMVIMESFDNSKIVVETTLTTDDAGVKRKASTVKEESLKNNQSIG